MVLGIIGLALCWFPFVGWICALVGVILSGLGIAKANKVGGKNKGMAIAGLVCGIMGLLVGVALFFLVFSAAKSFEAYVEKSRASESRLHLRSIETRVKTYYIEKSTLPPSAPEMPGKIADVCTHSNMKFPVAPQSAWTGGWQNLDFTLDFPSFCSYEFVNQGQSATAIARCDLDCDGTPSETRVTFSVVEGVLRSTYDDPTPD